MKERDIIDQSHNDFTVKSRRNEKNYIKLGDWYFISQTLMTYIAKSLKYSQNLLNSTFP